MSDIGQVCGVDGNVAGIVDGGGMALEVESEEAGVKTPEAGRVSRCGTRSKMRSYQSKKAPLTMAVQERPEDSLVFR